MDFLTISRRAALLGLAASVASCGFRPLYAPGPAQDASLAAVYVDIIPNRNGQLLRQALQQRLEGSDAAVAKRFVLGVYYIERGDGLGVQSDNSTTRIRDLGEAGWSLRRVGDVGPQITGGSVRALDGYNVIDEQFFYQDLSEDAAQRRIAEALADQIAQAVAIYLRQHPKLA